MVRGLSHLPETRNAYRGRPRIRPGAPARLTLRRARAPGGPHATARVCAALGGCTGGFQSTYNSGFWVQPGKYEFLKCPDLARRSVDLSDAEKKLVSQMERANQDVAGPLINLAVYRAQLEQIRANIELVQRTAREKGCKNLHADRDRGRSGSQPHQPAAAPPSSLDPTFGRRICHRKPAAC